MNLSSSKDLHETNKRINDIKRQVKAHNLEVKKLLELINKQDELILKNKKAC